MRNREEQPYIKLFLSHIEELGPATAYDLAANFSLSIRNTREYCKLLHEMKKIYICSYIKKQNGPAIPVYALNPLEDLEDIQYPKPLTNTERMQRRRRIIKASTSIIF